MLLTFIENYMIFSLLFPGTKTAHDDRAFSIIVKDGINKICYIDLEASTPVERDRWVEAIKTVVECVKNGTV